MNYTVNNTASLLQMAPQGLRQWLKQPGCPIGMAYIPEGSTHYTYVIYPAKVKEYFGEVIGDEKEVAEIVGK